MKIWGGILSKPLFSELVLSDRGMGVALASGPETIFGIFQCNFSVFLSVKHDILFILKCQACSDTSLSPRQEAVSKGLSPSQTHSQKVP